eukprot:5073294-Ditylum_brightwellii.AAC.1
MGFELVDEVEVEVVLFAPMGICKETSFLQPQSRLESLHLLLPEQLNNDDDNSTHMPDEDVESDNDME